MAGIRSSSCNTHTTAIDADLPLAGPPPADDDFATPIDLGSYDDFARVEPGVAIYDPDHYYRKKAARPDYWPAVGVALALVTAAAVYGALVAALL